ncbi:MAG TPA: hypothetical protein VN444_07625, partial [Verrucomicrobiae bacterium]|nr:hypothetical protein [Verrucomicrobiae bacterium]
MSDPVVQGRACPALTQAPQYRPSVGALDQLDGIHRQSSPPSDLFHYDCGLLYEINGRLDDDEGMYRKAITLKTNDVFLKAIRAVRLTRKDHRCV